MEENQGQNSTRNPDGGQQLRKWSPVFSMRNRKEHDRPFHACLQESKVKRKLLYSFLQDTEFSVPSWEVEEVRKFFEGSPSGDSSQPQLERAWIDYRRKLAEESRVHPEWRNPTEVSTFLKERSVDPVQPLDVIRRTIYIPEITRDFIHAIAQSASWNEVSALRAMVRRHIARGTSFQVHIPPTGFKTFRLELSLPLLVLREEAVDTHITPSRTTQRAEALPIDLSFLNLGSTAAGRLTRFSIRRGHDTVLIFGCDQFEWNGFAFSDYRPDSGRGQAEDEEDSESNSAGDVEDDEEDEEDEMPDADLFASSGYEEVLDTLHHIIWDPRVYFLRTAAIRLGVVFHEYAYLVEKLNAGVNSWVEKCMQTTPQLQNARPTNTPEVWHHEITQIRLVLRELRKNLSAIMAAGEEFADPHGGIHYFTDITDQIAERALHRIRDYFVQIKRLEKTLDLIDKSCEDSEKTVTTRIKVEEIEQNAFISRSHRSNLKFSRKTMKLAETSLNAAEETSRTTRTNVQLLLFTTPCVISLQYFCAESNFLKINRTPKTFVLSLMLLMFVTYLVSIGVDFFNFLKGILLKKAFTKLGRKRRSGKSGAARNSEDDVEDDNRDNDDDDDENVADTNMRSTV
ncbi:hypothetical protein IQ07DRAFT_588560 [Pyrenochaeta sp. DS3sAY3a]|nr:hypothetical protein IQ07DRAFT_588560 [Pyrenochaeta sp. DS3sAY3a]